MAMDLVAKAEHGVFMVKENFKYAFRNVPMCSQDLNLLDFVSITWTFKAVCKKIGISISPDKSVGPVQVLNFQALCLIA